MPNYAKIFQDEVRRLARKELKSAFEKTVKDVVELRRAVSEVKRRIASLERETKRLSKEAERRASSAPAVPDKAVERARISGKTVRTMRQKLGLTQAEFAQLLGVSAQSVYQWERHDEWLQLRGATKKALVEARGLGVREARRRLEAM